MAKILPSDRVKSNRNLWETVVDEIKSSGPRIRESEEYKDTRWIIFPDDPINDVWSFIISVLLVYTCTITPYRICLVENDSTEWTYIDISVDVMYFFDVIFNCFLAYYDSDMNLVVTHKGIIIHYAKTWMLFDVLSIIPTQFILGTQKNYANLIRVGRDRKSVV